MTLELWIYEIHIFELRNEEINVKPEILAVYSSQLLTQLMQLRILAASKRMKVLGLRWASTSLPLIRKPASGTRASNGGRKISTKTVRKKRLPVVVMSWNLAWWLTTTDYFRKCKNMDYQNSGPSGTLKDDRGICFCTRTPQIDVIIYCFKWRFYELLVRSGEVTWDSARQASSQSLKVLRLMGIPIILRVGSEKSTSHVVGTWLLRSWPTTRRITIKLHLTGKSRLIFKFYFVIGQSRYEVTWDF